jgi:hypothetical protein
MTLQATALNRPLPTTSELWVATVDGTPVTIDVFGFLGLDAAMVTNRYAMRATFKVREGSSEKVGVVGFATAAAAAAVTPALASTNSSSPDGRVHELDGNGDSFVITQDRRFLRVVASASCTLEIHFEAAKAG